LDQLVCTSEFKWFDDELTKKYIFNLQSGFLNYFNGGDPQHNSLYPGILYFED